MEEAGFKNARLSLDEPRAVYYSGQVIYGHIECELSQPVGYTAIKLYFSGEANVFWSETEYEEYNGIRRCIEVGFKGREEYFNIMECVSEGTNGPHRIPFQFRIPQNAPSTFRGDRGSISYKMVAVIEFPPPSMGRSQLETAFEVVAPLDYNRTFDVLKQPVGLEIEEVYSCCCSSAPVSLSIHLPTRGYCPGQAIPIIVNANNESSVEVKTIVFQLVKKICYHSQEPQSDYIPPEEVLGTVQTGTIMSNTKRTLRHEIEVPDMIAPNLENCSIIDVGYFLKVLVQMSGCNDDIEDEAEISIGLVPLASTLQGKPYVHPMQSDLPQAPIPGNHPEAAAIEQQSQQNHKTQNSSAYPTASPYPNSTSPYPNSTGPYPNSTSPYPNSGNPYPRSTSPYPNAGNPYPRSTSPYPNSEAIPLNQMPEGNIGFVMPSGPQGPGNQGYYPVANAPPPYAPSAPPPN